MAQAKEWIDEIKNMGLDQKGEIHVALQTLENWEMFRKEYTWTRIFDLKYFIERDSGRWDDSHIKSEALSLLIERYGFGEILELMALYAGASSEIEDHGEESQIDWNNVLTRIRQAIKAIPER